MMGLMQRQPLLTSMALRHAARHHGDAEIVSRLDDGSLHRTSYAATEVRARRLARALKDLGVRPGDRVATLAMNGHRHFELYHAISGIGAVCNTINPRLAPDDIAYIVDHAEDRIVFADPAFAPLLAAIAPRIGATVRAIVLLAAPAEMRPLDLPPGIRLHAYEALIEAADPIAAWPEFDENSASGLCYTSGTTGRPRGVLYSHRSTILHAMMMTMADTAALRAIDRALPVVPMFHVNAWGLPFAAPIAGTSLILPGRRLDPDSLIDLLNAERVTISGGVPTVWLGVIAALRASGGRLATLERIMSGGSAFPRALMAEYEALGIRVMHVWGMSESNPVATWNAPVPHTAALDAAAALDVRATQGRTVFGVEVRAIDDDRREVPWDGRTPGNIEFRGPWVATGYFRDGGRMADADGWFPTGDVGMIDRQGFVRLTDRSKDLIKSGGEWISSIELENIAVGHPDVAEAAAIAARHPKWGERPLLLVVAREGRRPDPDALRSYYDGKVAKWAIPDRVLVVDGLPHGATGKLLKTALRAQYGGVLME